MKNLICQIIFSGRVQGVGFRYTTSQIISDYPLKGYVQNLPGGTVKLILQGEQKEIEAALAKIGSQWKQNIEETEVRWLDQPKMWTSFFIKD